MHFCLRTSVNGATRPRLAMLIFVCAFFGLSVSTPALAQFRKKGKKAGDAAAAPAEEKLPPGMTMSKTQAVFSLISALQINRSDAARETLEQIVLGKISFGAHNQQAAESALAALAMRRPPDSSAFLLRLLSEPDDKIRPGDTTYPSATVRYDAARVSGRVGSPELRVGLAKAYDRAPPEIRSAIETTLSTPSPANFSAQLVLVRSRSLPDPLRATLQKLILDQNAIALKQALKLGGEAPAKPAAPASVPGVMSMNIPGPGSPAAGSPTAGVGGGLPYGGQNFKPGAPAGPTVATTVHNPVALVMDMQEKVTNSQPADPAVVARELWQNDVVEALAAQLVAQKARPQQALAAVGSIPLKTARQQLRDFLQTKSPQELGPQEQPAAAAAAPPGRGMGGGMAMGGMGAGGGGRGRGMGGGGRAKGAPAPQGPTFVVGADWLDPGSIVVMKTLTYKDRPKTRHRPPSVGSGKRSPAAEKRAEELAEKQKQAEAQYEWRDTIEKFVSHWDDRLGEVAVASDAAGADKDAGADKEKADAKDDKAAPLDKSKAGTKPTKAADPAAKKRTTEKKDAGETKTKGPSGAPTPAVPCPFSLRPGEKITKEFHLRWPEDLPANMTAAVSEPLVIHYVQLEGSDDINRTATFYRSGFSKGTAGKSVSATHDLESGKWVDIMQRDFNGKRTRSLDVLITRQPPDPEAKKSKIEELTIQVLMVEVESFEPEPKQTEKTEKKEQAKNDSP
ncbi:MAG TPA: hypothetical protein VFG04_22750 [Planctomycetaceae bacterium]|jgi:hypothetical protein|nr:hypothetical protein [Planctomycetaceae bacterium]